MATTPTQPRIVYHRVGDSGPPVLLIMGFGMRGNVWQPQVDDLSRDHRLIHFDGRGVGESETGPPPPWRMTELADDALRVLDAAGFETAHVVGVSMGGMVAQELALRASPRVESLTLIATHPGGLFHALPTPTGIRWFLQANLAKTGRARAQALQRLLYTPDFVASTDQVALGKRMKAQLGSPAPRRTLLGQLGAILQHHTLDRLHQITQDTLVIRPAQDVLVRPSGSDLLARGIPGARLHRIDDAGHGVTFQSAAEVNEAIRDQVRRNEKAPGRRGRAKKSR